MYEEKAGIIFLIVLGVLVSQKIYTQEKDDRALRFMFYNVENAFDTYNDPLTEDDDFLPDGVMRWNQTRYKKKINYIYKTIVSAGEWSPPDLVAFCEVENKKVLEDLVNETYLSKYNYQIIHEESPDRRGIDVCLIYREEVVSIAEYHFWIPPETGMGEFDSRSVLYAKALFKSDTIHLIFNHWPSRRGGVLAGEDLRLRIASMVRKRADSISLSTVAGAKIIIAGDFNSTPDDRETMALIEPGINGESFINLSAKKAFDGTGTYRYKGTWEMIDQVIVSEKLMSCNEGLYTDVGFLRIFKPDFLITSDPVYPGSTPFSMYRGYRYNGGFSDHLPVLLDLHSYYLPE